MDFGIEKAMKKQERAIQSMVKKQDASIKKAVSKQDKDLAKFMKLNVGTSIRQEGRVTIPAKRKHEVENKYKNKCAVCKKKPCNLHIHHKDMKNNNNALPNLELLCPTHHTQKHEKEFRRVYKDKWGNKKGTRLVKKINGKAPKKKVVKRQSVGWGF